MRPLAPNFQSDALTLWWLQRRAQLLLVCSEEERGRIQAFAPRARVRTIPHFVEYRSLQIDPLNAKDFLELTGYRVLTLLGYIHPRKGHELLIQALPDLPPDTMIVFAGAAEADHTAYLDRLLALAALNQRSEQVRVTGFITERELELYLAATDLAICPFADVSASGSISTWISGGTPILASDLPLIREYNRLVPGAVHTFSPYSAEALARAACSFLTNGTMQNRELIRALGRRLGIHTILENHIEVYREVLGKRLPQPRKGPLSTSHPPPPDVGRS